MANSIPLESKWILMAAGCATLAFPVFCGLIVGQLPVVSPIFRGNPQRWRVRVFWYLVGAAAAFAALAVAVGLWANGNSLSDIGVVMPGRIASLICATFTLLFFLGAVRHNPQPDSAPGNMPLVILPHTRSERLVALFLFAPMAGFCEELVYRGFFLSLLGGMVGFWPANVFQSLVFGFHHGGFRQGWPGFLFRGVFGFAMGLLVWWQGNLVSAMVIHYLFNAAAATRPPNIHVKAAI